MLEKYLESVDGPMTSGKAFQKDIGSLILGEEKNLNKEEKKMLKMKRLSFFTQAIFDKSNNKEEDAARTIQNAIRRWLFLLKAKRAVAKKRKEIALTKYRKAFKSAIKIQRVWRIFQIKMLVKWIYHTNNNLPVRSKP